MDDIGSVNRVNGGMHYADAVYRKHAPAYNYVRYITKLINHNLFGEETHLMCFSSKTKIRISYDGEFFLLLSPGWVENFRRIRASAFDRYLIEQLRQKGIPFDTSSFYYHSWIIAEKKQYADEQYVR